MLNLALLAHSSCVCAILLKIGFADFRQLFGERRQAFDCFDEIDPKELVVDGGQPILVALKIGKIPWVGGCVRESVLLLICLLSSIRL